MAPLSQILANIYTMTMLFFSILLLELAMLVRAAARAAVRRSITTDQFLKIVDQKAPARRYEAALGFEPPECSVCLCLYEEGDEIRKLKCKHTFHKCCVDTWLQRDYATCPLCRRAVLPPDVVVKHRNHRLQDYDGGGGGDEELMLMLYVLHGNFARRFS